MTVDNYTPIDEAMKQAAPEVENLSRILYDTFKEFPELSANSELNLLVDSINALSLPEKDRKKMRRKVRNADEEVNMALISNGFYVKGDTTTLDEIQVGLFVIAYNDAVNSLVQEGILYIPDAEEVHEEAAEVPEESVVSDAVQGSAEEAIAQDEPAGDEESLVASASSAVETNTAGSERASASMSEQEAQSVIKASDEETEVVPSETPVKGVEDTQQGRAEEIPAKENDNTKQNVLEEPHASSYSIEDIVNPDDDVPVQQVLEEMGVESHDALFVEKAARQEPHSETLRATTTHGDTVLDTSAAVEIEASEEDDIDRMLEEQLSQVVDQTVSAHVDAQIVGRESKEIHGVRSGSYAADSGADAVIQTNAEKEIESGVVHSSSSVVEQERDVSSSVAESVAREVVEDAPMIVDVDTVAEEMQVKESESAEQVLAQNEENIPEPVSEVVEEKAEAHVPLTDYEAAMMEVEAEEAAGEPDSVYEEFERDDEEVLDAIAHHEPIPEKKGFQFKRTAKAKAVAMIKAREQKKTENVQKVPEVVDDFEEEQEGFSEKKIKKKKGFGFKKKASDQDALAEESVDDEESSVNIEEQVLGDSAPEKKAMKSKRFALNRRGKKQSVESELNVEEGKLDGEESQDKKRFGFRKKKASKSDVALERDVSHSQDEKLDESEVLEEPKAKKKKGFGFKKKAPSKETLDRLEKRKLDKYYKKATSVDWEAEAKNTEADNQEESVGEQHEENGGNQDEKGKDESHTFLLATAPPPPPKPPLSVWDDRDTEYNDAPQRALSALNAMTRGEEWFKPRREGTAKDYYTLFGNNFKNAQHVVPAINRKVEEISGISNAFMLRALVKSGAVVVGRNSKIVMVHKHIAENYLVIDAMEHIAEIMGVDVSADAVDMNSISTDVKDVEDGVAQKVKKTPSVKKQTKPPLQAGGISHSEKTPSSSYADAMNELREEERLKEVRQQLAASQQKE